MSLLPMNGLSALEQLDLNGHYSYADYLKWKFKEQIELIKGKIISMSPAPARRHQEIARVLVGHFFNAFSGHPCRFYFAPFDVRFPDKDGQISTVVQPDLCVICDPAKLDDHGAIGAPDLVVEILSPSNSKREMKDKFELYQEQGVTEYWIVSPQEKTIFIYVLREGRYIGLPPVAEDEMVTSETFPMLHFSTEGLYEL